MWVSTFHSACVRILRRDAGRLGYPSSFSIYDQADAQRLTGYVIRDLGLDPKKFTSKGIHAAVSAAKNDLVSPAQYTERVTNIFERRIADIYREYQARLEKAGAMDFDDLLTVTVRLFHTCPDVLEHYQQRFEHILVDEYQDTNRAQNELVLLLGAGHHSVTVVGDSDQCLPPGTMVADAGRSGADRGGASGRPRARDRWAAVTTTGRVAVVVPGRYVGQLATVRVGGRTLRGTPGISCLPVSGRAERVRCCRLGDVRRGWLGSGPLAPDLVLWRRRIGQHPRCDGAPPCLGPPHQSEWSRTGHRFERTVERYADALTGQRSWPGLRTGPCPAGPDRWARVRPVAPGRAGARDASC